MIFAFLSAGADDLDTKIAYLRFLESEISQINSELTRCNSAKRQWRAATVIGGIGVVGTGVGAAVQAKQISDAKKDGLVEQKPAGKKDE